MSVTLDKAISMRSDLVLSLGLPTWVVTRLRRRGINSVQDLTRMSRYDLLHMQGVGAKSALLIIDHLARSDLSLRQDDHALIDATIGPARLLALPPAGHS